MSPSTDTTTSDQWFYLHKKHNISCYYYDFKTCTVQTDAEIYQPGNQLSFMLHELVFLGCHSQFASYPYTFASYSYSCKILQPYVVATVRMHSDAVSSSTNTLLMKPVIKIIVNNKWSTFSSARFCCRVHVNQP